MYISNAPCKEGMSFYLDGRYIGFARGADGCTDRFIREHDGIYRWERTANMEVPEMEMSFIAAYPMQYQMIPSLMYNQNLSGEITDLSTDRLGKDQVDEPSYPVGCVDPVAGSVRKFAWWRSSVAGASYSEGNGLSVGMFLPPGQRDASFSILPDGDNTRHTYYWPLAEGPRVPEKRMPIHHRPPAYKDEDVSHMFKNPGKEPPYKLSIAPRRNFAVMLVIAPADVSRTAWHRLMSLSWSVNRQYSPAKYTDEELWDLSVEYTKSLFCEGEDGFRGFTLGKVFIDGQWIPRPYYRFEMGWTGQGISLGANMLAQAFRKGDSEAGEMGFAALDSWLLCKLPSGILPTHIMGQQFTCNGRRVVDACNLAGGAVSYFRAWEYAQALGKPRPEYFEAACKICDFAVSHMSSDGKLAKSWFEDDLEPAVDNGNSGAFLALALCEGAKRTHKPEYLERAVRCYNYYYNAFIKSGYSFGGAQDKFSIDKESCIPMLRGALMLHDLTGRRNYIEYARDAAHYLSTWQWQHTHPLEPDSILGSVGYDTYGGTSVSINGSCPDQDPYALPYVHDLYDLAELTGEAEWAERAHAAWVNGSQSVSDGTLVVHSVPVPLGAQLEAVGFGRPYEDGAFMWMPGWMACFRMENLCRTLLPGGDRYGRVL